MVNEIGEIILETKFIGLEGFNEIESLPTKKRRVCRRELTTAQKTVRFVKRATTFCAKSVVRVSKNSAAKLAQTIKNRKGSFKSATVKSVNVPKKTKTAKTQALAIDRAFRESRSGTTKSAREIVSGLSFKSEKQYAHLAPSTVRSQKLIKKKAVLAVVACFSAITLSCVTVASALDVPETNTNGTGTEAAAVVAAATSDEAVPDYTEISDEYADLNTISPSCASLYIDGNFIGATEEIDELKADLDQVLVDYRKDYDDETTTEFANSVEVVTGNPSGTDLVSAEDVMALADGKFSISLSTDIVYTRDVAYDTKVKYDEDKSSSYKKVTTEGVKGEEEVTVRTTFVDGVQTDAVQTDAKTIKEAVDEVVVKGKAEDTSSSTGSSSTSSDSSSSSSSDSSSSYTTGSSGMFAWPLPYTHTLTSTFGTRWGRLHGGLDISAGGVYGQPIYASASGTVTFSGGDNSGYGNYVIIDHGSGYTTLYGHCSSLVAVTGQYVNQGDLIGYVGSTGNSTGPHLHFEIRLNGEKMDPLGYTS